MRPVNLVPVEDRRGEQAPLRTGPLAYIVVGALLAALAGVTMLVLTGNQISERKAEVAELTREDEAEASQAQRLSAYTHFREMSEQRVATVQSLADSRFDWERVMRELALILPSDVWLVSMDASVAPGAGSGTDGGNASGLRAAAPGPALELNGCATGQVSVAGFVTALKDIEGVTRVGVESSELGDEESGAASASGDTESGGSGDDCRTRSFIAKFQIVVAFDAAPVPASAASEAEAAPVTTTEGAGASEEPSAEEEG